VRRGWKITDTSGVVRMICETNLDHRRDIIAPTLSAARAFVTEWSA
jgi:hypothetical protein